MRSGAANNSAESDNCVKFRASKFLRHDWKLVRSRHANESKIFICAAKPGKSIYSTLNQLFGKKAVKTAHHKGDFHPLRI